MPAVMILIMIPVMASVAMMTRIADYSMSGFLGAATFAALACGCLFGLFRFAKDLDGEEGDVHA